MFAQSCKNVLRRPTDKLLVNLGELTRNHYGSCRAKNRSDIFERLANAVRSFVYHDGVRRVHERLKRGPSLSGLSWKKAVELERVCRQPSRGKSGDKR